MSALTLGMLSDAVKPQAIRETALAAIRAKGVRSPEWSDHEDDEGPVAEDRHHRNDNSPAQLLSSREVGRHTDVLIRSRAHSSKSGVSSYFPTTE